MHSLIPFAKIDEIPGWFKRMDMELFRLLLDESEERLGGGDLAELGVYLGKSAALMGRTLQPDETFTVVDLFSAPAWTEENQSENDQQYAELSQEAFERHYLTANEELPVVVRGLSHTIVDHASPGTHRFVHIDASHLYEHVLADIDAARTLLKPDGVVVLDDYRTVHAPGVAAAIWRESTRDLTPFAVSMNKLYATFGDADPWVEVVREWLEGPSYWQMEVQQVAGRDLVRVQRPPAKVAPAPAPAPAPVPAKRSWLNRLARR